MTNNQTTFDCIVIGGSAGAFECIRKIIEVLPDEISIPIVISQHLNKDTDYFFVEMYKKLTKNRIVLVDNMAEIKANTIYIAPANYHLLVENRELLVLSSDEKVNYSRPSIDVLFESAARVFQDRLLSILLTGANNDGANGSLTVKKYNGCTIAQNPKEAQFPEMPESAINNNSIDNILSINKIGEYLLDIMKEN